MEKYVGIDCSSKAVHVVVLDGKEQLIDKFKWESKLTTADARFLHIVDQVHEGLEDFTDANLICIEESLYVQNPWSTRTITAIIYSIIYFAHKYDVKCTTVNNRSWKKDVVGKGTCQKSDILKYSKAKWKKDTFDEQDYADAACIALYGLRKEKETENAST